MILIADAGGTKTDWRLIGKDGIQQFQSSGISISQIRLYGASIPQELPNEVEILHFYGAGLVTEELKEIIRKSLKRRFTSASIAVNPDTLAAARATCGNDSGWVGILGTGSAMVYFDGNYITRRVPSLGFILGDEGSGTDIGMRFFKAFLRNQLDTELHEAFVQRYSKAGEENILHQISLEESKGFFNSTVPFLVERQNHPLIFEIVEEAFSGYFSAYSRGGNNPEAMHFTGSVAHYFSNVLRTVAQKHQISIGMITQYPIAGLTLYHQKYG